MENHDFQHSAQNALKFTSEIVDEFGARIVGDPSTHGASRKIKDRWSKIADKATIEEFLVRPKAFLAWVRIKVVLYMITLACSWFNIPWVGIVLMGLGLGLMVFQFFFYKEIIDPFFKKKIGMNVVASIEPLGEVKQQIIVSGHHDSAYEFNFLVHQPKLYNFRINGGIGVIVITFLGSLIWTILQLFSVSNDSGIVWLIWKIFLSVASLLIVQLYFFAANHGTPGAGDNMISTAVADQVGVMVVEDRNKGHGLKHTRVILGSWDAEEAGLRGAKAYCKAHEADLKKMPTYVFNMDCIYKLEDFSFLTSDINLTVQLSEKMASECVDIATSFGYPSHTAPIAFLAGGTDAGEFGRIGVDATTLLGMPWNASARETIYHTMNDTVDTIEPKAVEAAIKIAYRYIRSKDEQMQ